MVDAASMKLVDLLATALCRLLDGNVRKSWTLAEILIVKMELLAFLRPIILILFAAAQKHLIEHCVNWTLMTACYLNAAKMVVRVSKGAIASVVFVGMDLQEIIVKTQR